LSHWSETIRACCDVAEHSIIFRETPQVLRT
jgi:hypothetical protein